MLTTLLTWLFVKLQSCTGVISKVVEAFHICCLQGILWWWHKVPHVEISRIKTTPWSTPSFKGNCSGSAVSSECHPIVFPDTYRMESSLVAIDHRKVRRSASLIAWRLHWRSATYQPTSYETLPADRFTWWSRCFYDRVPQKIAVLADTQSLPPLQVVHAVTSAAKCALLTLVFEVIFAATSN